MGQPISDRNGGIYTTNDPTQQVAAYLLHETGLPVAVEHVPDRMNTPQDGPTFTPPDRYRIVVNMPPNWLDKALNKPHGQKKIGTMSISHHSGLGGGAMEVTLDGDHQTQFTARYTPDHLEQLERAVADSGLLTRLSTIKNASEIRDWAENKREMGGADITV